MALARHAYSYDNLILSLRVAHGPGGHAFENDTVLSLRTAEGGEAISTCAHRDCFAAARSDKSMSLVVSQPTYHVKRAVGMRGQLRTSHRRFQAGLRAGYCAPQTTHSRPLTPGHGCGGAPRTAHPQLCQRAKRAGCPPPPRRRPGRQTLASDDPVGEANYEFADHAIRRRASGGCSW